MKAFTVQDSEDLERIGPQSLKGGRLGTVWEGGAGNGV